MNLFSRNVFSLFQNFLHQPLTFWVFRLTTNTRFFRFKSEIVGSNCCGNKFPEVSSRTRTGTSWKKKKFQILEQCTKVKHSGDPKTRHVWLNCRKKCRCKMIRIPDFIKKPDNNVWFSNCKKQDGSPKSRGYEWYKGPQVKPSDSQCY